MRNFENFFRHIKSLGFSPDICIDVGAGYGTGSIYSAFPDAHHIIFEPVEDNKSKLSTRLANLSHEIHICGLMDKCGTMKLAKFGVDNLGSTFMSDGNKEDAEYIEVPIKVLDDYIDRTKPNNKILLKIDCQGSDLDVIRGGEKLLEFVDLVIIEASLFQYWGDHHPILLEICNHMNEQGFSLYDILDPSYRPLDNALGQVDLVFSKSEGFFREHHKWGSNKSNNTINTDRSNEKNPKDYEMIIKQKDSELSHLRNLIKIREDKPSVFNQITKKLKNITKDN